MEKEALINEKKNQATEKLIKKSKMKATKLIWDPISKSAQFSAQCPNFVSVLDEGILLDEINEQNGMIKPIESGFDDSFLVSPLLTKSRKRRTSDDIIELRSPTPPSVGGETEEEYELFFSIVSEDGFSQSGKSLDAIWNNVLDQLEVGSHTFPGSAPRSTRPDVYKVVVK